MKRINMTSFQRMVTGLLAISMAGVIGFSPMTVLAQGKEPECICDVKCTEDTINKQCPVCGYDYTLCEGKEPEKEEEHFGPLTPDGNLTLVDDYGSFEAGGKQFITVVTKAGNYFYIIIDRDDQGDETVHFLNMVDEADLLSLMDEEAVEEYIATKGGNKEEPPVVEEKTVVEEPKEEPAPTEPEKKNNVGAILALVILVAGGIGGFFYVKNTKEQKAEEPVTDPDADYDEDEDDYLDKLSDEDEGENEEDPFSEDEQE